MKKKVFADTDYWVAILNPREQLHAKAKSASLDLSDARLLTSEMVLTELLAFYSVKGGRLRQGAVTLIEKMRQHLKVTIVPQTSMQFQAALAIYKQYYDKEWSLTDCASILIMRQESITDALSYDQHFEQAGFRALLRGN
jgi:predicted nucleic acid-binding protein